MNPLALFARTCRRHGFRASVLKALARTMHRRVLIEGVDDDFPRPPPPRDFAMPTAYDANAWHLGYGGRWKHVLPLTNERMMLHVGAQSVDNFFFVGDAWAQLLSRYIAPGRREMARVLADGGLAVVSFHDRPEARREFSGTEHRADYDAGAFKRMFADAGFDVGDDVGDVCGQRTLVLRKRVTR